MHPVAASTYPATTTATDGDFSASGFDPSALSDLHDLTVDTVAGFATMVEKAEPGFRATAEQFRTLHAAHAQRLARLLAQVGGFVDPDGTVMGSVNKAVITVRSWFDEIDEDVMDQVRNGEDTVLAAFDTAIASHLPAAHHAALRDMRDGLTDLLAQTAYLD